MSTRRLFVLQGLVLAAWPCASSLAQSAAPRVVLKGHDPVAYFTESRPVKGSLEFKHDWDGERYLFASAANREKFVASPERYAPQFDGYCTGSMAKGVRNEADPEAWVISEGKLYVFGAVKFKDQALKDVAWLAGTVVAANQNWQAKRY